MSEATPMAPGAPPKIWPMYRSMVGVGIGCGLLIVSVFQVTRPVIERNQREALQRAIFQVVDQARSSRTFRLDADDRFRPLGADEVGDRVVYAGYDEQQRLVGLALEARGMGYQDVIRVLYGYSFEQQAITGIRVLESKETPGLGDKIETDAEFLRNFERLDVSLDDTGATVAHPIEPVKHGAKEHAWQVDGITGATISSKAIANMLRVSTAYWIPKVRRNPDDFRQAE